MLRARTLVRRLSCGHSSLQYRALLHGLRSASGSAKSVPRAAAATSDAPLQFDESILRMLMREAMEGREGMPQVDGLSTHAQPGRQPGPRKRARISATSQRGVSSSALPALQEVGPSEGTAQSRLAVAQLGPVIEDEHHPLRAGHLPLMTLRILSRLRKAGHECYVVGGAIRDLLLGKVPKDFDVLTTATPAQVKKIFKRARIVGKRYPIVHVYEGAVINEVSSFTTNTEAMFVPQDIEGLMEAKASGKKLRTPLWSEARRENARLRDFSVNAFIFDPFSGILYDYMGAWEDCQRRELRTIDEPDDSFTYDPARILRAVRLACRAGLMIEPATSKAMEQLAPKLGELPGSRLAMEVQVLMGYGAAEASMRMLWRMNLLDLVLPLFAAHLKHHSVPRRPRAPLPQPLFDALAALDQLVTPAAPVETHVWMAALAAPLIADRLEAVQAGSEGALTDDSSDLDDSALDDGALDADDSSPELDDESDDGDESEALLAAGDARAGEEGMESVQLNRKQRRAMMLADRKKAKAKGEPTPAAVPTNATIQMPARVLRAFNRQIAELTQPLVLNSESGPAAIFPKTQSRRVLQVLLQAHTLHNLKPPEVVVKEDNMGNKRKRRLDDHTIVAHVLKCPSLRWHELTGGHA